ncbi:MAG: hypothetical protein QXU40_03485 [Candidatus Pacearchaeota archaeon]
MDLDKSLKRVSFLISFVFITLVILSQSFISSAASDSLGGDNNLPSPFQLFHGFFSSIPQISSDFLPKFLFFLLVFLIVFSISNFVPLIGEDKTVSLLISLIVGILSTRYLLTEDINTILLSYNALGITLTVLLPMLLLLVLSVSLFERGYAFFSKVLWIVFGVVLFFRWLSLRGTPEPGEIGGKVGAFGEWIFLISIILTLILFIFYKQIVRFYIKTRREGELEEFEDTVKRATAVERMRAAISKVKTGRQYKS